MAALSANGLIYMYTVKYTFGIEIFGDNLVNHINEINMIVEYVVRFPEPSNEKKNILIFLTGRNPPI